MNTDEYAVRFALSLIRFRARTLFMSSLMFGLSCGFIIGWLVGVSE